MATCGALLGALSCSNLAQLEPEREPLNACVSDADCATGSCDSELAVCVQRRGTLRALLLDVLPPAFGSGLVSGDTLIQVSNLEESGATFKVHPYAPLNGRVYLSSGDPACRPSPVRVNLSPVARFLGINAQEYSSGTRLVTQIADMQYVDALVFTLGGVPDGQYDVVMRDAGEIDNSARTACQVAPELIRNRSLFPSRDARLVLNQPAARPLRVSVPYVSELSNWWIGIVHSTTSELLSSEVQLAERTLTTDLDGVQHFQLDLRLTSVEGPDWAEPGSELIRLRPPVAGTAPTVYLALSGLEVHEPGQAQLPRVESSPARVRYRAWVWRNGDPRTPVSGQVTFNAETLTELKQFRTEFQRTESIDPAGQVTVLLPPGNYVAHVRPNARDLASSYDAPVTVWAPPTGVNLADQSGAVFAIPAAARVTGRVEFAGKPAPAGTRVRLRSSRVVGVERRPGVLERAPRDVEAELDGRGRFTLENVDCGSCSPGGSGDEYTLAVIPPGGAGLSWWVRTRLEIRADRDLGVLQLDEPSVYRAQFELPEAQGARGAPRLRVAAYALIDSSGSPLDNAVAAPCSRQRPENRTACAERAIAVGEALVDTAGGLSLLLPADVRSWSDEEP